jgi:hypothetical protein
MKKAILSLAGMLAVAAVVVAQNLPTVTVQNRVGRVVTVGASTNTTPTAVTTNFPYQVRAWLLIQNTNAAVAVTVYAGTTTNAPVAVLQANGGSYLLTHPTIDNGAYSVRSHGAAVPVLASEGWGQ